MDKYWKINTFRKGMHHQNLVMEKTLWNLVMCQRQGDQ